MSDLFRCTSPTLLQHSLGTLWTAAPNLPSSSLLGVPDQLLGAEGLDGRVGHAFFQRHHLALYRHLQRVMGIVRVGRASNVRGCV